MDWENNAQPSRVILPVTFPFSVAPAAGVSLGPFAVGDLQAIGFELLAVSGNGTIEFEFYADPAGTLFINSDQVNTNAGLGGERSSWTIPVSGPFMRIQASGTGGNMNYQLRVWADAVPSYIFNTDTFVANPLIIFNGDAVAHPIGITDIQGMSIFPGPASFYGACSAAATQITLYGVTGGGTRLIIAAFDNPGAGGGSVQQLKNVMLPPMHLMLRIINNSAAPQIFGYALVAKYGLL